jgi:hypothetical protein
MPEVNYEWVRKQLEEAKVKIGSGKAILKLLETWETFEKLTPGLATETVEVFSKLALGKMAVEPKVNPDEVWVPVQPGQIIVGDEVRFRIDAFSQPDLLHKNGRRCKVIAIRYGDVIVNSIDEMSPAIKGDHSTPYNLEKRVK